MSTVITSRSGPDSKLHLEIPVSQPGTDYDVEVVVRSKMAAVNSQDYLDFLRRTAGAWLGEFELPARLPPEDRERL